MANEITVKVPDIGGATEVDVIEILVKVGDTVTKDMPLVTLESDKASMEIPSPEAGKVSSIALKLGDKVSEGAAILTLSMEFAPVVTSTSPQQPVAEQPAADRLASASPSPEPLSQQGTASVVATEERPVTKPIAFSEGEKTNSLAIAAGPAVRRMAREFGVDLNKVSGSGRKNRISKEDLQDYVKQSLNASSQSTGFSMPSMPVVDFTQFGPVDSKPLNKIKRLTGVNLHRAWITVPHVTQFDEADITDLEAFRKAESDNAAQTGYKLTLLAFVTKVVCKALIQFPQFNASLDSRGENLIYKQYYNIGIAVDTPNGLVVPVIKQANQLSVGDIATQMALLSKKARDKALLPGDMSGGCFTISSLGGVGGTAFTPIVNAPEVAILGLSRAKIQPVYSQGEFKPRLMLPISLSYDHRVIDGAEAARFTRFIAELLGDIRRVLL
jgi:pyruvate dehydrogenase E2 component (dihydrolipoamide acetyltransferase)